MVSRCLLDAMCHTRDSRSSVARLAFAAVVILAVCGGCGGPKAALAQELPRGRADFEDIRLGAQSIDFVLRDIRGRPRRLSALYEARVLVLQFASMSCPHYVNHLREVGTVMLEHRTEDVIFVTVYTREAHPEYLDEETRPATWEDRRRLAARWSYQYDYEDNGRRKRASGAKPPASVNRITLVDELSAVVGSIYGCDRRTCNPAFVIDGEGIIVAKTPMMTADFLRWALSEILSR